MSHSPRQACARASTATSAAATVSDSAPLHGTAFLPVCRHGLGPWAGSHRGLSGESCSHTTHSHRASLPEQDRSICKWRKCPPSGFQGHAVSQPSSPLLPRHRHSNSSLPNLSSEKGEKSAKSPAGLTKWRAQHWNKVIYNQEKGRKPLLLEAASHWSVQLHTAQKSNYTNTLCVRFPIKCVFH